MCVQRFLRTATKRRFLTPLGQVRNIARGVVAMISCFSFRCPWRFDLGPFTPPIRRLNSARASGT